jgi:hypothetical protein
MKEKQTANTTKKQLQQPAHGLTHGLPYGLGITRKTRYTNAIANHLL